MRKMLYISHDLKKKLDTTSIFQFLSIFAQNVTIYHQNSQRSIYGLYIKSAPFFGDLKIFQRPKITADFIS